MTNNDIYLTIYTANFINYTTCFGPNGPSSVFPFISNQLTELQREHRTFSLTYIGHIHVRPHSFSLPPYLGILTSVEQLYLPDIEVKIAL
jgi:hypothetical protein